MKTIILKAKEIGEIKAALQINESPNTCKKFWKALPLKISLSAWGDELFGTIPVEIDPENPKDEFEVGDIAYWLSGCGFCILFGRTPVSRNDKPRLISPGNYLAKIEGDASIFKGVKNLELTIERGNN